MHDPILALLSQHRVPGGKREQAERFVEICRISAEESKNPVFAWRAYRECREAGIDLPEWVLEYIDCVAAAIDRLAGDPPAKNKIAPALADALLMKSDGAGTVFSRAQDVKWIPLGMDVDRHISHGDKEYLAVTQAAAQNGVSPSTVWRAWKRYQACFTKS
jgi:hypothetical protein